MSAAESAIETGLVHCPEPGCGFHYTHPIAVVVNSGGVITAIDHDGTTIARGEPAGRGVAIGLRFRCERGHEFAVDFRFHKGETGFAITPLGASRGDLDTIWRD